MFLSGGNVIINKTAQEPSHKEASQTRVEVKNRNPPKTTSSPTVKLPRKLKTPAPIERKNSKPKPIVTYKEDKYTSLGA